jgi:hypothetical protein
VLVAAGVAGFKEELVLVAAAAGAEFTADDPAVDAPLLAAG